MYSGRCPLLVPTASDGRTGTDSTFSENSDSNLEDIMYSSPCESSSEGEGSTTCGTGVVIFSAYSLTNTQVHTVTPPNTQKYPERSTELSRRWELIFINGSDEDILAVTMVF